MLTACWAMAARSTERCRRQATMPRQRRMARPKAPRMAPTAMKTVPSGRVEWFMNGALWVGGMVGAGYSGMLVSTVLERLGIPGILVAEPVVVLRGGSVSEEDDVERDDEDDDEDVVCFGAS